jgi:hypothetical protein
MFPINYQAIAAATVAAFLFSALYYFVLNKKVIAIRESYLGHDAKDLSRMSFNKIIVELTRTFVVGIAMAYALTNAMNIAQAAVVVVWLWIAFPVVLMIGMVVHERFPASLAFIHVIDWLAKLLIFATVLTLWR